MNEESDMETKYPEMILHKSRGVSNSEKYLVNKCEKTFLSLWSYSNLYTQEKKGKELCDVLAVFDNHIFIFSDKYCQFSEEQPVEIAWNRWFRHAIDDAAKQIIGAERYIQQGRPLYLDPKCTKSFPLNKQVTEATRIHRIIVARGIKKACCKYFGDGNGSLIVDTTISGNAHYWNNSSDTMINSPLFRVGVLRDRKRFIHVFDDYTLNCILEELDTVSDFVDYLEKKEAVIVNGKNLLAAGEEDILAKYVTTVEEGKHCIVEKIHSDADLFVFEDNWFTYSNSVERKIKKQANQNSYLWDRLLEKTFQYMMSGRLREMSHCDYYQQSLLFTRFASPNRVERRALADSLIEAWNKAKENIPSTKKENFALVRRAVFPDHSDTMLTIMWRHYDKTADRLDGFLKARKQLLNIKMLDYANKNPSIRYHIGIAKTVEIEEDDSEDFAYFDSTTIPDPLEYMEGAKAILQKLSSTTEQLQLETYDEYRLKPEQKKEGEST